jgi:hypothetical protein
MKPNHGRLRCNPGPFEAGGQMAAPSRCIGFQAARRATRCTTRMRIEGRHHRQILRSEVKHRNDEEVRMKTALTRKAKRPKEALPPRAGKSSPSLRFTAGLRFAPHFPLRSRCGRSPLACLCYPPPLAGKAGVQLRSTLLSRKGKTKLLVDRSSLLIEGLHARAGIRLK